MALARYQFTATDNAGNIIPGASVEVRSEVPGQPLVQLYSDRDGGVPIGNPFTADDEAFAAFHAPGGAYQITASSGAFERVWRYVAIGTNAERDFSSSESLSDVLVTRGQLVRRGASAPEALALGSATALLKSNGTDVVWGTAGNIEFPATPNISGSANVLDDYEEGTFTPTLTFGGAAVGITGSFLGNYTKVGNRVVGMIRIILTSKGSSTGTAVIGGLPFTVGTTGTCALTVDNLATGAGVIPMALTNSSSTEILPRGFTQSTGTHAGISNTAFTNTTNVLASFAYDTTS